ncbi:MAG: dihydroorotase [Bacteroidales bacterium]|jgi:dihydroorotase|nr:dihydroorotase [Bacteroidales bacterium]
MKNTRIVDECTDRVAAIAIDEDGMIAEVSIALPEQGVSCSKEALDIVLMPAFTDLHVHFRDPGFTHKEDVASGSRAAAAGGYTAVNLMPNTNPVCSTLDMARDVEHRARETGLVHVNQTLCMTENLKGENYQHLLALPTDSVLFVTDDGKGVNNDHVMKEIMKICREKNITIMAHEEDSRFSLTDTREAENRMTFRDLQLCSANPCPIHFCHVSTKEAIHAIAEAKRAGLPVTCEVTPHHLVATGIAGNYYRVNPPLREQEDIDALIHAIQDGIVDAIATDHAPHTANDKANGAPGIDGLETAFPLCYTALVKSGKISLSKLVQLMSGFPSRFMRLNKGMIKPGMDADFVWVDLNARGTIRADAFVSKSNNTPFDGWLVYGKILKTMKKGKITYEHV